jgi:hypothetical protein
VGQRKSLLERQRAALDLQAGQRLPDVRSAPYLGDPVGPEANRFEESRRLLDRLELAEHAGGEVEAGLEVHWLHIGRSQLDDMWANHPYTQGSARGSPHLS